MKTCSKFGFDNLDGILSHIINVRILLTFHREFYRSNRHLAELKVTDPDQAGSEYFAAFYKGDWHRAELCDERMGESVRVCLN